MLYVYGIVDSCRFDIIRGEGHDGGDVVPVPAGTLAAAVSGLPACTIEATPQNVWRHERVLGRLMQDHAVLPLRFGTICREAGMLRDCLLHSADGLVNDLGRVRGKVEIALRVVEDGERSELTGETVPGALPALGNGAGVGRGTAYLRTRLQHRHGERAREDGGKRLEALLRRYFDASLKEVICALPPDDAPGFLVSCLVERDQVTAFADTLEGFRGDYPRFDVTCTGPWAPYSFTAASALSGGL